MKLENFITNVPNFPKEGIQFKDITTLLNDGEAFKYAIDELAKFGKELGATVVLGPDARGFIIGCPIAYALGIGFVPVRKPGKLPRETVSVSYDLEYGSNTLCMHKDAVKPGDKVLIIDDLLATGGTVDATIKLVESLGASVVGVGVLIELLDLNGKEALHGKALKSLIQY